MPAKLSRRQVAAALREFLKADLEGTVVDPEDVKFSLRVVDKYEKSGARGLEPHEYSEFFELLEHMLEWE